MASVLSFIWPGLGQAYAHHGRRALLFALPPAILVGLLIGYAVLSPEQLALRLLVPTFALGVIVLLAIHGVWRVLAILDAWRISRARAAGGGAALLLAGLVALTVVGHVAAGWWVQAYTDAGAPIFNPPSSPAPVDDIIGSTGGSGPPPVVPLPATGPINTLFVGVDSAAWRDHALTDSIMLVSYDRTSGKLAMVSVPRDTGRLPYYGGGTYANRINSLLGAAKRDPAAYPDGPVGTLVKEVDFLLGTPIQYYAVVDMAGFARAVDLVGGIDVTVPYDIVDNKHHFYLHAGFQHMDGHTALLYARSRYGPNNSDYARSRRQQDLLRALVKKVKDPAVVIRAPEIVSALAAMVRTNVPLDQLSDILDLLASTTKADAQQYVLKPTQYATRIPPAEVGGRYMTQLKMDAVAALSIQLWGTDSRYSTSSVPQ